jgi:hypothetical protein
VIASDLLGGDIIHANTAASDALQPDEVKITEGGITDVTGTVPLGGSSDVGGTGDAPATADIGATTEPPASIPSQHPNDIHNAASH